jgi:hypothetical protein
LLFGLLTVVSGLSAQCYAQTVSSTELINSAKLYDGKTVVYEGEVIGDIMARGIPAERGRDAASGRCAWVNLNDGQNAIGIWMPEALTKDIRLTGSYKSRGDWIEVTGVFHRACADHGGDLDIHAQAIRKIQSGKAIVERANPAKRNLLVTLLGILCLIVILRQFKRA